jgi:hypothetical protein
MNKQIGSHFPEFSGYYIGSLSLNNTVAEYFIAEKGLQILLPWGNLGIETGIYLPHYTDSQCLNVLTNETTNSSYNGRWNTQNFLYNHQTPAGCYCLRIPGDFFLPSLHELFMIQKNLQTFNANCPENQTLDLESYWSSSEYNLWKAWSVDFSSGKIHTCVKHDSNIVRPITKFVQ